MKLILIWSTLFLIACQPLVPLYQSQYVSAVGMASISAQNGNTLEDRKFKAIRASKLEAYRELTEQIYGVRISSEQQVYDQTLVSEGIVGVANGVIKAAKVVASYQVGDSYITELQLNLDSMKEMSSFRDTQYVPVADEVIF